MMTRRAEFFPRCFRSLAILFLTLALFGCELSRHKPLWTATTQAPLGSPFALVRGGVVIPNEADDHSDLLSCFGITDGAARWHVPLDDFIVGIGSSIYVSADPDGSAVYVAQGADVASFGADDGVKRWSQRVLGEYFSTEDTAAVVGERLYLLSRPGSRVVAFDRRDGALAFRTADYEGAQDLTVRDGALITRSAEVNDVRAHDALTGAPLWRRTLTEPFATTTRLAMSIKLAPDRGPYLVVDGTRNVLALDARTGAVRWQRPVLGLTSYAWAGATVVVTDSASVRGIDAATGAVRWRHPTDGISFAAPLDDTTALLALPTWICTVDVASGAIRQHFYHELHEQDGVLDARRGFAVLTLGNVAWLYQRDGKRLFESRIGEVLPRFLQPAAHGIQKATIAGTGAVTFNTAHELERFTR